MRYADGRQLPLRYRRVIQNVSEAEVMSVFFPTFRRALIIDTRSNESVGPFVRLMPMARSPQDRMRSIRRLRPQFPRPANLTLIPWQRYVDSLVRVRCVGPDRGSGRSIRRRNCHQLVQPSPERSETAGTGRAGISDNRPQLPYDLARRLRVRCDADRHRKRQARTEAHCRR